MKLAAAMVEMANAHHPRVRLPLNGREGSSSPVRPPAERVRSSSKTRPLRPSTSGCMIVSGWTTGAADLAEALIAIPSAAWGRAYLRC